MYWAINPKGVIAVWCDKDAAVIFLSACLQAHVDSYDRQLCDVFEHPGNLLVSIIHLLRAWDGMICSLFDF